MANARALDRRRKSIRNIRKITRTMELIATTQFQRAMNRALAASAYTDRITALVRNLTRSGATIEHPLLRQPEQTNRAVLLVLSANRGMCGGYNSGVIRQSFARWNQFTQETAEPRLEISGKRGISAFRFRHIQPDETYTHFDDQPQYDEVVRIANRFIEAYQAGYLDRLDIVYTKFESLSRHHAVTETLLPLGGLHEESSEEEEPSAESQYEFLPSAESILDAIVPTSFKVKLFKCFLDAAVSEQVARMLAMKAATENADTMIHELGMAYNRARQGQITSDLLEIQGGAEALNK